MQKTITDWFQKYGPWITAAGTIMSFISMFGDIGLPEVGRAILVISALLLLFIGTYGLWKSPRPKDHSDHGPRRLFRLSTILIIPLVFAYGIILILGWLFPSDRSHTSGFLPTSIISSIENGNPNENATPAISGSAEESIAQYTHDIELNPNNVNAYLGRAAVYVDQGLYTQALADYAQTIRLAPNNRGAFLGRADVFVAQGVYGEAIENYTHAIELNPEDPNALLGRANAFAAMQSYDQAILDFTDTIRIDPDDFNAYLGRGTAYVAQQMYNDAIADFSRAIEIDPENAQVYYARGNTYSALGLDDKASADLEQAMALDSIRES